MNDKKKNPLEGMFAQVTDDNLLRENGLLYAENKQLQSNCETLNNRIKELEQINEEHRKLNGQLRENWNKIREWVEEQQKEPNPTISITFTRTLVKMNELEKKDKE